MKLFINDTPYDIYDAITDAQLGDLRTLDRETTSRGSTITAKRLRTYLVDDLIKNDTAFGYVDTNEKMLCLSGLIWLCWRAAGEDRSFVESEGVKLSGLRLEIEDGDYVTTPPKEPTDSDPGDAAAATTT
jgi:hypothetical protein